MRIDPFSEKYDVFVEKNTITICNNNLKIINIFGKDTKDKFIDDMNKLNSISDDELYIQSFDILCEIYEKKRIEDIIKDISFSIGTSGTVKPEMHAQIAVDVIMKKYILVEKV